MLRQMEEEMRRVRVQDLVAQSVVSILNLAYRRIAKEDERDLEQARVGIEAIRGMVDALDPEAQREIRNALSQVQVLYAQAAERAMRAPPRSPGEAPLPVVEPVARRRAADRPRRGSGLQVPTRPEPHYHGPSGYAPPAFRGRPGESGGGSF